MIVSSDKQEDLIASKLNVFLDFILENIITQYTQYMERK